MSEKRVTVRDIAARLKVSSGTVHRALNDKPGVGDELRAQIRAAAEEMGYRPNVLAATLKMKPLRIVLAFPSQERGDNFYYHYVWQGCRRRLQKYSDFRLDVVEVPYERNGLDETQSFAAVMQRTLQQYPGAIDGVIASGLMRGHDTAMIETLNGLDIPIVMLCEGVMAHNSLCVVEPDNYTDGRVAAELLRSRVAPGSRILVCAGSPELNSNAENLRGFHDGLGDGYRVKYVYGVFEHEHLEQQLAQQLARGGFAGAYSVAARATLPLCNAIRAQGLQGSLCTVGSDIYPESAQALRDGVVDYLLYKKPGEQGARGVELMMNYLLYHTLPEAKHICLNSAIVLRSNLDGYLAELPQLA